MASASPHPQMLGRYLGIAFAVVSTGTAIGALSAPLLIDMTSTRTATITTGLLLVLLSLATWRACSDIDQDTPPPDQHLIDRLRADAIFAPLSEAQLEQLARAINHPDLSSRRDHHPPR